MEIRRLLDRDERSVQVVYRDAFLGPPWLEDIGVEEVGRRWREYRAKRGFDGRVALYHGDLVGAIWWDTPTPDDLRTVRGDARGAIVQSDAERIYWVRDTVVSRCRQGIGIGRELRSAFIAELPEDSIALTRHRDDNTGIIRLSETMGFRRTGIRVPSSQIPGLFHEYWYYHKR